MVPTHKGTTISSHRHATLILLSQGYCRGISITTTFLHVNITQDAYSFIMKCCWLQVEPLEIPTELSQQIKQTRLCLRESLRKVTDAESQELPTEKLVCHNLLCMSATHQQGEESWNMGKVATAWVQSASEQAPIDLGYSRKPESAFPFPCTQQVFPYKLLSSSGNRKTLPGQHVVSNSL